MTFDDNVDPTSDLEDVNGDPIAQDAKSPAIQGEADPFSGDASDSSAVDIDEELKRAGLSNDDDGVKPLGSDE